MRFLALLAVLAACHQDVPPSHVLTPATTASATPSPSRPVPPITITVMTPGAFEIENTSGAPVKLWGVASIVREDGKDLTLDTNMYRLVESCDVPYTPEVEIPVGATFRPKPWSGFDCTAQCLRKCVGGDNTWEGGGRFRFVVRTSEGADIATPFFQMPRDPRPNQFARQSLRPTSRRRRSRGSSFPRSSSRSARRRRPITSRASP